MNRRQFLAGAMGLAATTLILPPSLAEVAAEVAAMEPDEIAYWTDPTQQWPGHTFDDVVSAWFRSGRLAYATKQAWLMSLDAEPPTGLRLGQQVTLAPGPGVSPRYGEQVTIIGLDRRQNMIKVTPPANATGLLTLS